MDNVLPPPKGQSRSTALIPSLIISVLGIIGIAVLYLLFPGLQAIDVAMLLIVVCFAAASCTQGILRGVMTVAALYIATGIAATFYPTIAPYVSAFQQVLKTLLGSGTDTTLSVHVDNGTLAFSFSLLTVVIWVVLELLGRGSFQDTSLPALGILDKLGGIIVYLLVGILVATLLFNAIGYGGGRGVHDAALLRPQFNQVLRLHYITQLFWFPRRPPPLYVYDLKL